MATDHLYERASTFLTYTQQHCRSILLPRRDCYQQSQERRRYSPTAMIIGCGDLWLIMARPSEITLTYRTPVANRLSRWASLTGSVSEGYRFSTLRAFQHRFHHPLNHQPLPERRLTRSSIQDRADEVFGHPLKRQRFLPHLWCKALG